MVHTTLKLCYTVCTTIDMVHGMYQQYCYQVMVHVMCQLYRYQVMAHGMHQLYHYWYGTWYVPVVMVSSYGTRYVPASTTQVMAGTVGMYLRPSSLMSVNERNKVMMRGLHRLRGKRVARTHNVQFMATNVLYITELHNTHSQKYIRIIRIEGPRWRVQWSICLPAWWLKMVRWKHWTVR